MPKFSIAESLSSDATLLQSVFNKEFKDFVAKQKFSFIDDFLEKLINDLKTDDPEKYFVVLQNREILDRDKAGKILGNNLIDFYGADIMTDAQAHHLIPFEIAEKIQFVDFLMNYGYSINNHFNGVALPQGFVLSFAWDIQGHAGFHKGYNELIKAMLNPLDEWVKKFRNQLSKDDVAHIIMDVNMFSNNLRKYVKNGDLPLYKSPKKTKVPDEHISDFRSTTWVLRDDINL